MNTIFNTALRLTLVSTVLLSSCYKIDVGDLLRDRDKVNSVCKIKRLKYTYYYNYVDSPVVTEFRYNKWGDPDSIISSLSNTGHPGLHLFYYDLHHRLTEYMSLYRSSEGIYHAYHVWSRYNYDHKGRIAWDSTYYMANYVDGHPVPPSPYNTNLMARNEFFYDQYNRIIKVIYHWGTLGNSVTYDYKYTPQGNLDNGPYDNKVNIYQVHKIWQFLATDYSINNPLSPWSIPLSYNKYGLPTSYSGHYHWLNIYGDNIQVEYDCK
jgi:hypothetical protein